MANTKGKMDKLTIAQWNIQGLRAKYEEFRSIFNKKKLFVACLQETLLGDSQWKPSKNFKMEKSPYLAGLHHRGVAMVLHSASQYTRIPLQTTLEAVAITIHSGKKISICSIYLSPNSNITKDELRSVISQLPRPFLLLGDFNAKHPLWDPKHPADQRGKMIEKIIMEESLALLNDERPTHYHIQTNTLSTIDLALCSVDALGHFKLQTDTDLHGSDHFPLYLTASEFLPQRGIPRWLLKKANWTLFEDLTRSIEGIADDDPVAQYNQVVEAIKEAASKSIPKSDGHYNQCPVPWWNNRCEAIKKLRNRAQKEMFKHPTTANKMNYKKLRGLSQRTQKDAQIDSWKTYVSTVNSNTECSKVWKRVSKIKGKFNPHPLPTLKVQGNIITSPQDVANSFARCYQSINMRTKMTHQAEHKRSQAMRKRQPFHKKDGHQDNNFLNSPFSLEDLETNLSMCKDTAPGPDDITISMLNHLPKQALSALLNTLNRLWSTKQVPSIWNKEVKIPILKPGKDPSLPESYRPISLTSCICKLFERMVNHRLMWFLEKNNILSPQQSGFRKNKSTMDALSQLTGYIKKGFKEKKHTTAVFFDMEKAYDTVWRDGILNDLYKMGLRGNLPTFIDNFLSNREFCVRIGASHSGPFELEEGLPQGSVLSVTCFAVAINDIVSQISKGVQCTLYVDDFTIFVSARNEAHSNRAIQLSINRIKDWTKTKGLKLSVEKTIAVKFEPRRRGSDPVLTLNNNAIQVREATKYLGLIIDKRLSFKQHIEHLRVECTPAINLLKHLSHLSWGADRRTLKVLFSALVQSKLDYGAHIYGATNSSVLQRLNPIQNSCLRACTGAFRSSPAASLCTEAGVLPLKFSRDAISLKYFFKSYANPDSPTHEVIVGETQEDPPPNMEYIQPMLEKYQLTIPKIMTNKIPETPPWSGPSMKICPFTESTKKDKNDVEMRSEFLSHQLEHLTEPIYTDGSKMGQQVGFAAKLPSSTSSDRLPKEASIFTAEMYAIKIALEKIINEENRNKSFTIYSDSQSAIQALKPNTRISPLTEKITSAYRNANSLNISIDFCWVPGHIGVKGNEEADTAAKNAARDNSLHTHGKAILHTDMKRPIQEAISRAWHSEWLGLGREGAKLREIKQDINGWNSSYHKNRRAETAISRLRIGHTNLTHSYLMEGQANPPICERCNQPITVKHILLECRNYTNIRNKYFTNPTLAIMLGNTTDFSASKLIAYLRETELLSKI